MNRIAPASWHRVTVLAYKDARNLTGEERAMLKRAWLTATLLAACALASCGEPQGAARSAGTSPVPDDFAAVVADDLADDLAEMGLPNVRELDPKTVYLQGPHFHVGIEEVAEVSELDPGDKYKYRMQLNREPIEPLRARPGKALLLVRLYRPSDPHEKAESVDATGTVVVAGKARSIGEVGRSVETLIAVSVDPGAEATLVVSDSGREQSINLRTGARGPDALAAYHPVRSDGETLGDGVRISGNQGGVEISGSVSARKYPYLAGQGWAPPGRVWLQVKVGVGSIAARYSCDIDAARSFSVRGSVGAISVPATSLAATSIAAKSTAPSDAAIVMDIADAPVTLDVAFRAQGTCRSLDGGTASFQRFDLRNQGKVSLP
jgi:hypothetical protein